MDCYEQLDGYNGENYEKVYDALNFRMDDLQSDDEFSRNVALLLLGMGMEKYIELFQTENIGINVLASITEDDLRAIGIDNEQDIADIRDKFCCDQLGEAQQVVLTIADDTVIMKKMVEQTNKLVSVFREIVLKLQRMKKKLTDQRLSPNFTQVDVLNTVLDENIVYIDKNLRLLYAERETGLINDIVQREKLKLPKFLKEKLSVKKQLKKPAILFFTLTVASIGIALFRYIS